MIQKHVPKLSDAAAGRQAFEIEGGHTIIVEITRKQADANPDNLIPMPHQALRVRAFPVNVDGSPILDAKGKPVELPHRIETLIEAAIAEGTVDLNSKIVEFTVAALERARNYLIVKEAFDRIPVGK
ncbi:hypothetical protein Acid345_3155 [Candidatus Koribacter versatilis Ellin345]|uniref:Uncharacterized protein n=1 Tax=Koribacter versatilis (strain Ellin345) TaxID=204669 RepID=Q1ILU4_KORVE|nr:hypothetical protein [Candidatus Koribacter versatilis]ABF42156.1 hypothetical protein Acid345_3155 [Candidatus Koribacter versatilis Ellin345]